MFFDVRTNVDVETHKTGKQNFSFSKENNLFGNYPYKSHPQMIFEQKELPARFSGSIHYLNKDDGVSVLSVKHGIDFIEENDFETGQFDMAYLSDATIVFDH